jgi:hypothetical protein
MDTSMPLCHLRAAHRAGAGGEFVGVDAEALEHIDEQIG